MFHKCLLFNLWKILIWNVFEKVNPTICRHWSMLSKTSSSHDHWTIFTLYTLLAQNQLIGSNNRTLQDYGVKCLVNNFLSPFVILITSLFYNITYLLLTLPPLMLCQMSSLFTLVQGGKVVSYLFCYMKYRSYKNLFLNKREHVRKGFNGRRTILELLTLQMIYQCSRCKRRQTDWEEQLERWDWSWISQKRTS